MVPMKDVAFPFEAAEKAKLPLFVPVWPEVIVIQLTCGTADHTQPIWVETLIVALPPDEPKKTEAGDKV